MIWLLPAALTAALWLAIYRLPAADSHPTDPSGSSFEDLGKVVLGLSGAAVIWIAAFILLVPA
jgi:hypothetical protein